MTGASTGNEHDTLSAMSTPAKSVTRTNAPYQNQCNARRGNRGENHFKPGSPRRQEKQLKTE